MEPLIFVNGCFDILHIGHLDLLDMAASYGGFVVVAVDSDARVKQNKGAHRPINSLAARMRMLASLRQVDRVVSFSSDDELDTLIKTLQPDVMVKGAEYKNKPIIGAEYCKEIVYVPTREGYSTTQAATRQAQGASSR